MRDSSAKRMCQPATKHENDPGEVPRLSFRTWICFQNGPELFHEIFYRNLIERVLAVLESGLRILPSLLLLFSAAQSLPALPFPTSHLCRVWPSSRSSMDSSGSCTGKVYAAPAHDGVVLSYCCRRLGG